MSAEVDAMLSERVDRGRFSGAVLVGDRGTILLHKGYGFARRDERQPNTRDTIFHLASLSKLITRTAIVRLAEAGRLSLDDPVSRWMAPHPSGRPIVLRHLLEHTSGIPDLHNEDRDFMARESLQVARTLPQLIARFWQRPLHFEPGARVQYSNSGYVVLARVIEQATGLRYDQAVHQLVFEPAGMSSSSDGQAGWRDRRANGYTRRGVIVPATPGDLSNYRGSGSICSTTVDMLAWRRAIMSGRLLGKPGLAAFGGRSHAGHMTGFDTALIDAPSLDVFVLVLANQDDSAASEVAPDIWSRVVRRRLVAPDDAARTRYVGRYSGFTPARTRISVNIEREDSGMIAVVNGRETSLLRDPATGAMVATEGSRATNLVLRLEAGPAGAVELLIDESGQQIRLSRVTTGRLEHNARSRAGTRVPRGRSDCRSR